MHKKTIYLSILASLILLSSCGTHSKMVYFQSTEGDSTEVNISQFKPTFKADDFISVVVTANDLASAIPFNYPSVGSGRNGMNGYVQGAPATSGYLIDGNGFVNLPILGKIKLGGLGRTEAIDLLEEKLNSYLKNPVVNIRIQNYKVTVLGDVSSPGTYNIPNERFTILEAIGLSGDLTITGLRNNVLVIRDENGKKKQYRLDLTSDQILNSPAYYLQQNDVVYVEPNTAKRSQGTFLRSTVGILISLTSLIITTIVLISR